MNKNTPLKQFLLTILIIAVACQLLANPNQSVSAKTLLAPFTDCASQSQIPESECNALVTLYNSTNGANWNHNTDWLQTDTPCSWFGITCANGDHVTGLSLIENNLFGALPAQLADLTQLTTLELRIRLYTTQGFQANWAAWSDVQTFNVEQTNLDAVQLLGKNNGFNLYRNTSHIPTYWKALNFLATDGKNTSIKKEGIASLKIAGAVGQMKTLTQTLTVSGPASDHLIFPYWVKGSAIPSTGTCQGQIAFYNGNILKSTKILKCPAGANYNFKKMTLNITVPVTYTKIIISFIYNKLGGTIWLDAVGLIR